MPHRDEQEELNFKLDEELDVCVDGRNNHFTDSWSVVHLHLKLIIV